MARNRSGRAVPEALEGALVELGRALSKGRAPPELLDEVMGGLEALPANAVIWAEANVRMLAELYIDRSSIFLDLIRPRRSALDLLALQPRLGQLFLFHRDGHVRQAALDGFTEPPATAFFLAALVLRLNDWARPVRVAARYCGERLFPRVKAEVIAAAAPFLLDRWRHWGRWEPEDIALVDRLLQRADLAVLTAARFANSATGPLATELRYAQRGPSLDAYLPGLARDARQPAVRATALQALLRGFASWPVGFRQEWVDKRFNRTRRVTVFAERRLPTQMPPPDSLIRQGLGDRSSLVRRIAADALIERRGTFVGLDEVIAQLSRDQSPALRERAAFLARKQEDETLARQNPEAR